MKDIFVIAVSPLKVSASGFNYCYFNFNENKNEELIVMLYAFRRSFRITYLYLGLESSTLTVIVHKQ